MSVLLAAAVAVTVAGGGLLMLWALRFGPRDRLRVPLVMLLAGSTLGLATAIWSGQAAAAVVAGGLLVLGAALIGRPAGSARLPDNS